MNLEIEGTPFTTIFYEIGVRSFVAVMLLY